MDHIIILIRLLQAEELRAKIDVLKCASLEAAEQVEGLQEELKSLRAKLADKAAVLHQAQADAAQTSQQAQCSAAHADRMQEECGRLQAELEGKFGDLEQARLTFLQEGEHLCMALRDQSPPKVPTAPSVTGVMCDVPADRCNAAQAAQQAQRDAAHAAEELAQSQSQLQRSKEAEQSALDAQRELEHERTMLLVARGMHRLRSSYPCDTQGYCNLSTLQP